MHHFRPRLLDDLATYNRRRLAGDIGAGITVGVVALPLAMAFAIASGLSPEQGLATAIVGGLIISVVGGSSVQIGGPAGAFIVVVYGIVERHGAAQLLVATMMAGVMLLAMGWLRVGALVRFIPLPIVIGFTNGIAVLIGLSQVKDLLGLPIERMPADALSQIGVVSHHVAELNPVSVVLGLLSLAVVAVWPKAYAPATGGAAWRQAAGRWVSRVPGTLMALVLATVAVHLLSLPVETIGSRFGAVPATLPSPQWPALSWLGMQQMLMPAFTLALLGAIESLLCARVADQLRPHHPRHEPNQELMAQGLANIAAPIFGGLPATGTIARTVTNVKAGASSPVAGAVHALTLLAVMMVAAPWAAQVPLAALAGILLFVAWNMGEWHEFARLRQFSPAYRITLLGTFALTVVFDLTVAVEVGLLLACIFFVARMGQLFEVQPLGGSIDRPPGVEVRELFGALFFGAVGKLESVAQDLPPGTRSLVLDMHRLISMDNTGLDALQQLHANLGRQGTRLVLARVTPHPLAQIRRAGFDRALGAGGLADTLEAALAVANGASTGPAASAASAPSSASGPADSPPKMAG